MDPEKEKEFGPAVVGKVKTASFAGPDSDVEIASGDDREGEPEVHHPIQRVITAQDWVDKDDKENPHNWPLKKRIWHTLQPAFFGFAVTIGSSIYSPAVSHIAAEFHVSSVVSLLGVALYVLGLAFGPVLSAPLSERYGRLIVYRLSLPCSMLFTLGAGFSNHLASLLVCRFFAGLTGSPVLAVGAATNADLFPPKTRANATALFLLAPFLGTVVGPIIGGFCVQHKNWRWTQWSLLFISLFVYILSLTTEETSKKEILKKRAKALDLEPPRETMPESGFAKVKAILIAFLFRPVHMLCVEPIVLFLSLYSAFSFGVLFAFLPAFPIVFEGVYHFDISMTGVSFLSLGIGYMLSVPTVIGMDLWKYQKAHVKAMKEKRLTAPEQRLYAAMVGSFGVSIGLFIFGWTARKSIHWIVPMIGVVPFAWGNLCIFSASALYTVDVYGAKYGGSAMAANSLLRYTVGAAFPLFTVQMYHKLGIAWATSLLGFLSVFMLPIPFVLFKWGHVIRSKSSYDVFTG